MRVLVVHPGPNFSVSDVYTGWVEGLSELGVTVATYNLDDRLTFYDSALVEIGAASNGQRMIRKALDREQAIDMAANGILSTCYQFWPDVVLVVSSFFLQPRLLDMMRGRRHKVVLLHTESPYEDVRQLELAPHADLNLLNDPIGLERFAAVAPSSYIPHAYRPAVHTPGPAVPDLACDLSFIGTGYRSRIDFFEAMNLDGLDVMLAGNWQLLADDSRLRRHLATSIDECLDNEQAVPIYRSSKLGINLYRREAQKTHLADGIAMGPREVEMAATGLFFLRDPRPEGDEVLSMLPTFASPEDASEQLRYWLSRDDDRAELAAKARAAVGDRTFTNNAAALLRLLDTITT